MIITAIPRRGAAVAAVFAAALILFAGCGGPSDSEAKQTAIKYEVALDAGDTKTQCAISTAGQGSKRSDCLQADYGAPKTFTKKPEVVKTFDWSPESQNADGKAVLVKTFLNSNSKPQYAATGLLAQDDDRWLVAAEASGIDSTSSPTTQEPSEDAVVAALDESLAKGGQPQ